MGEGFSLFSVGLTRGSKLANLRASSGVTAAKYLFNSPRSFNFPASSFSLRTKHNIRPFMLGTITFSLQGEFFCAQCSISVTFICLVCDRVTFNTYPYANQDEGYFVDHLPKRKKGSSLDNFKFWSLHSCIIVDS